MLQLQAGAIVFVLVPVPQAKLGIGGGRWSRSDEGHITAGKCQGSSPASWQAACQPPPEGGLPSTRPLSTAALLATLGRPLLLSRASQHLLSIVTEPAPGLRASTVNSAGLRR